MSESNFNEVISVSFDLSQMRTAFSEMEKAYSDLLARMSKKMGGTPLSPGTPTPKQQADEKAMWVQRNQALKAYSQFLSLTKNQQDKISGQQTAMGQFWSGLSSNISRSLGVMVRYAVGVSLILEAMRAVHGAVDGVVGAFRTGVEHLAEMQSRSANLREAILENVKYSGDFAQNVTLAGRAADIATHAIEQMSARLGLVPSQVENAFKAFTQGGGLQMVGGDMQKAVTLAAEFASTMRAAGVAQPRRVISDIAQLMNGQVKSSNKLLAVLNLTPQAWQRIRLQALAHGDLVEQLESRLAAVNERLGTSGNRWDSLVASVKTYRDEFYGAMAESLWRTLIGYLQKAKGFFEDHKTQLFQIAGLIGDAVGRMIRLATETRNAQNPVLGLLTSFGRMSLYLEGIVDSLRASVALLGRLGHSAEEQAASAKTWQAEMDLNNARERGDKAAAKAAQERLDAAKKEAEFARQRTEMENAQELGGFKLRAADREARHKELDQLRRSFNQPAPVEMYVGHSTSPTPESYVNKQVGGDSKEQLAKLKEGYRNALAQEKQALQERQNLLEEDHARNLLSQEQFSDKMVAELEASRAKVDRLAKEYLQKVAGMGGLTPEQQQKLSASISELQAQDTAISREESKVKQAAYKDEEHRKLASLKRELQASKDFAQSEIQLARLVGISEAEVVDKEIAVREDGFQRETEILNRELIAARNNAAQREAIIGQLTLLTQNNAEAIAQDAARRRQAQYADYQRELQYQQQLAALREQAAEEELRHKAVMSGSPYQQATAERQILQLRVRLAEATEKLAKAELKRAQNAHLAQSEIDRAKANVTAAEASVSAARNAQNESYNAPLRPTRNILTDLLGIKDWDELKSRLQTVNGALDVFAVGLQNAPALIKGFIQGIQSGFESGGTMGAIGAGMSQVGAFIPGPIGAAVQIGGAVLSTIGSLFGNAAKKIAEEIRRDMEQTMTAYNNHTASLIATMDQLNKERADAVSRLSGTKGGGSELSKLLKEIDSQLAQLNEERLNVMRQFDLSYRQLELWSKGSSQAVVDLITQSRDMFKQIGDYIGAGGSAQKALQYLQWSMGQQKQQAAKDYRDAENEAIADAQTLNDLLKQRIQLSEEYKQNEYEALSKDSLERRTSQAVTIGRQIQQLTSKYKDDLNNLNSQIDLQQQKVNLEQQVFNIQLDSSSLAARSAANAIAALKEQLSLASDYWKIMKGAYDYLYNWAFVAKWNPVTMGSIPMPSLAGATTINSPVNIAPGAVTVIAPAGSNPQTLAKQISAELDRMMRMGWRPSYAR